MDRRFFVGSIFGTALASQTEKISDVLGLLNPEAKRAVQIPSFIHPCARTIKSDPVTGQAIISTMGCAATVQIDQKNSRVTKSFLVNGTCVGGTVPST